MKEYKSEQVEEKVAYEEPEVTEMGKVEDLTALLGKGSPDILGGHNLA